MAMTADRRDELPLRDQLFRECEAMAKYALASGLKIPALLLQNFDALISRNTLVQERPLPGQNDASKTKGRGIGGERGSPVLDNTDIKQLALIHSRLAQIVAPATPRTILLLAIESARKDVWGLFGPVPLIRGLMLTAILSLILFILVTLSPEVNGASVSGDIFQASGVPLLLNLLFFMSAAGLGASFAALFQANHYIATGTYDPKYASSYWIRFTLGIMAGFILAVLVPIDMEGNLEVIAQPTLAMLGGFSSSVVYRILNRLVETLESLVRGETRGIGAAQEQLARAHVTEQLIQSRTELAASLIGLQQKLSDGASAEEIKGQVTRILGNLVPLDLPEEEVKTPVQLPQISNAADVTGSVIKGKSLTSPPNQGT